MRNEQHIWDAGRILEFSTIRNDRDTDFLYCHGPALQGGKAAGPEGEECSLPSQRIGVFVLGQLGSLCLSLNAPSAVYHER